LSDIEPDPEAEAARIRRRDAAYAKAVRDDIARGRRRAGDYDQPGGFWGWARENAVLVGAAGIICTGIVFSVVFYTRLSDMIPVVAQLRKDLDEAQASLKQVRTDITGMTERTNELRAHLDKTLEQADTVRTKLSETDNKAAELLGRMDERIKGLENHAAPLPFYAPGKAPR
jgi:uncharacterized protein YoxC